MKRGRRGNMVLEAALWIPVMVLLLVGMVQVGKITYLYYTLKKTVYSAARYLSTQQGVDFCDPNDASIQAAIQFALTGTTDGSGTTLVENLTPSMLQVSTECVDPYSGALGACSLNGCGSAVGAQRPDYVVVTIPGGYPVQPRIPYLNLPSIPLAPTAAVPFGGSS